MPAFSVSSLGSSRVMHRFLFALGLFGIAVFTAACDKADSPNQPKTAAGFVTGSESADEAGTPYSGSAAERRIRLAERARGAYSFEFDLSGLPNYQPSQEVSGTLRLWGNNYVGDSGLAQRWVDEFREHQPSLEFELVLPTAAVAAPSLYFGLADIGMNHELGFYDYLAHLRILGYEQTGFSVVTGSYDISGWQNSMAIVVHKDNPLSRITMEQLDGVFGSERAGGLARYDLDSRVCPRAGSQHTNLGRTGSGGRLGGQADSHLRVQPTLRDRVGVLRQGAEIE